MRSKSLLAISSAVLIGLLTACGGSSGGSVTAPPPPPPPPPPPVVMSAAGIWVGQAVTPDVADLTTGFEFDDADGFSIGAAPFTAEFAGGVTESRGIGALYVDGAFSWHVDTAGGTVTFPTPGDSLSFSTRTVAGGDTATIQVLDENGAEISTTAVPDAFQQIVVNRDPGAGESLIGSVAIAVAGGEIVIDAFTFGFVDTSSTDDVACLFAPNNEFSCLTSDAASGNVSGAANGTFQVSGSTVTGSGNLYASDGQTLADGSSIAPLTISTGALVESTTLDMTVDSTGLPIAVTSTFDASYNRGADLATIAGTYATNDINGGTSSFSIDTAGVVSGQTALGCVFDGQVSVIDAAANAYDVSVVADAATCGPIAGTYDGLGSTQDENAVDDAFVFAVFIDGQLFIAGEAIK